ncbi:hypothetical protein DSO57_1026612 [Entomophthora muscae]|uniref:Uncharacterized protein n=1 Tax=Entomophthora muscae TaxID=34485 RepID=A0ACC2TPI7_9FUNG|nr:hypothetical protein DSO57_1026612 [Entomophthora muscae]
MNGGSKIVVKGALIPMVSKEHVLFQGSILLPFLFDMFVDPVAWQLEELFPHRQLGYYIGLFFANDIKLQHRDPVQL